MFDREKWLRDLEEREDRGETVDPRELHDEHQEHRDRRFEKADEMKARVALYPDRPVDSQVTPLGRRAA